MPSKTKIQYHHAFPVDILSILRVAAASKPKKGVTQGCPDEEKRLPQLPLSQLVKE